jgi:hypothetical protein
MQRWLRQSFFQLLLAMLAVIALGQMLVSHKILPPLAIGSPGLSSFANDVSLGYFSSWIFNILVVVLPAYTKRRRMRAWLASRYSAFKDDLVRVYLGAIRQSYDSDLIEGLRDPAKFSDYFAERFAPDQNRWHAVHNGLYEWGLSQIRFHCRLFLSEYDLSIGLLGDLDSKSLGRYGYVRAMLSKAEIIEPDYDDVKSLLGMLYPIHCPWSFLDGKIHEDAILDNIKSL